MKMMKIHHETVKLKNITVTAMRVSRKNQTTQVGTTARYVQTDYGSYTKYSFSSLVFALNPSIPN